MRHANFIHKPELRTDVYVLGEKKPLYWSNYLLPVTIGFLIVVTCSGCVGIQFVGGMFFAAAVIVFAISFSGKSDNCMLER